MKLQVPFVQLPIDFDASALAKEISGVPEECWRPHPQGFPGNSMLPLVAVDGDGDNEAFDGAMRPTPILEQCPYLIRVLHSLGATIGRTRLMRLAGQSEVVRHADRGYYWAERARVHVPVITQETVRFECGDTAVNMAAGECWIFDTWRQHRVLNDATESRIHLVIDTVGGLRFWDLVSQGRPTPSPPMPSWRTTRIEPSTAPLGPLPFEASNVPTVMSPWELSTHLGFLFDACLPHQNLRELQMQTARFMRHWRALWAQHGDAEEGFPAFRVAMAGLLQATATTSAGVTLDNGLTWFDVLQVMIARAAVIAETGAGQRPDKALQHAMGDNA